MSNTDCWSIIFSWQNKTMALTYDCHLHLMNLEISIEESEWNPKKNRKKSSLHKHDIFFFFFFSLSLRIMNCYSIWNRADWIGGDRKTSNCVLSIETRFPRTTFDSYIRDWERNESSEKNVSFRKITLDRSIFQASDK